LSALEQASVKAGDGAMRQDHRPDSLTDDGRYRLLIEAVTERSLGQSISIETRFPLSLKPVPADVNQVEMA
jgi:hypothetical protein